MYNIKPKVSIGMPVYNGEKFLRQALDSILNQTFSDFELIISDNNSIDNTQKICLEYKQKDRRIRFYRNKSNLGANYNFNKVLELAQADYFMWASHDDIYELSYISTLVKLLGSSNEVVLALSMFNAIDVESKEVIASPYSILGLQSKNIYKRLANYITLSEDFGKAIPIHGLMKTDFTKQAFKAINIFLKNVVWGSDALFIFQLLSYGEIAFSKEILFHKRLTEQSQSLTISIDWENYFNGYDKLIEDSNNLTSLQKQRLKLCLLKRRFSIKMLNTKINIDTIKRNLASSTKKIIKQSLKLR